MSPLYPLTFQPVFKRYLWGGRRLQSVLGKPIGEGTDYAESWEVADHEQGQSIVASGPLAGTTLHDLVVSRGAELLGHHAPQPRFPLIFKFLDCQRDLSVQVHPDDAAAGRLTPPDLGKPKPGSFSIRSRAAVFMPASSVASIARRSLLLSAAAVRKDVCTRSSRKWANASLFQPAPCMRSAAGCWWPRSSRPATPPIGCSIGTAWGPDGKPRKLHIDEALAVIDYSATEIAPQQPQGTDKPHVERLVSCDKFILDRWTLRRPESIGGDDRFHLISILDGSLRISQGRDLSIRKGETVLLPACLPPTTLAPSGSTVLLDMYLPG